jgi:hypothetical protein
VTRLACRTLVTIITSGRTLAIGTKLNELATDTGVFKLVENVAR